MQLSSLIGKPVLSPAGEAFGYVTEARPAKDCKTLSCLVCADAEEEEFFLPARAVISMDDAVIAGKTRLAAPSGISSPIGKEIFAYTGEYLGAVCDLLFDEGAEAILVVTKNGVRTTVAADCVTLGEHAVLYPDKPSRDAAARSAPKRKPAADSADRPKRRRTPSPADLPSAEEAPPAMPAEPIPAPQSAAPKPIAKEAQPETKPVFLQLLNRTNLLGRRVKRSVYDDYGVPVALAGERITPAVLARARKCNRLLQLSVNTLTV